MTLPSPVVAPTITPLAKEPRTQGRRRRILFWVAAALIAVILGSVIALTRPSLDDAIKPGLAPDSTAPDGAGAVTEVLKDHGIDLKRTESRTFATKESVGATLVVPATPALSDDAFGTLIASADIVVLISPTSTQLDTALSGTRAGFSGEAVKPGCSAPLVSGLGAATISGLFAAPDATACYEDGNGAGLLIAERGAQTIYVLDGTSVMSNEAVGQEHNAGLALRLLAQRDTLVWYVATPGDTDLEPGEGTTLGELTPNWVTPVIVLGIIVALAAIAWRGRRFGPLVAERLPVTVKISETLEGRAKLYARGRDTAHAARVLRTATTRTLARKLGLASSAPPARVASAAASMLAMNPQQLENLFAGPAPTTDAALQDLSDHLIHLEAAVTAAFRTERTSS